MDVKYLWRLSSILVLLLAACDSEPPATAASTVTPDNLRQMIVLHINDEHGWMEESDGVVKLMGLWRVGTTCTMTKGQSR